MRSILLIIILGSTVQLSAQSFRMQLAEEKFEAYDFKKAAQIFEDVYEDHPEEFNALRRAGEARLRVGDYAVALQHYRTLDSLKAADDNDLLNYAYALKVMEKYDAAVEVYERYLVNHPDSYLSGYADVDWAQRIVRDSARFEILTLNVNSAQSDFGVAFADQGVFFASARKQGKGKRHVYTWTDQSYLNLYQAAIDTDSALVDAKVMKNRTNSRFHEGTVAYDKSQDLIYFARNNYVKGKREDSEGKLNLGIYYAQYKGGDVGKLKAFPFNEAGFSLAHPVISPDGKAMYFVSDMPGGFGGTDIYVSYRNLDFWSEPQNLGEKINTPGDEMFPYLDQMGNFFFASDYHPGLGGLDIFYTNLSNPAVPVRNLGYPANSSYDDFAMVTFPEGKRGYFSSNRPGGKGDDDIYGVIIHPPTVVIISGRVLDQNSGAPIADAKVYVKDENGNLNELATSNDDGSYTLEIPYTESYALVGDKEGYFRGETVVMSSFMSSYIDGADLILRAADYAAEGHVLYADSGKPFPQATVRLISADGKVLEEQITGEDGFYYFGLEGESSYIVEASAPDFPAQSIAVDTRGIEPTVIKSDLRLFKLEKGVTVQLDNIYYDYNKATIRKDASRELDRLVKIMNENPGMKIELSAHTDSRGTDTYNERLSQRRAQTAMDYLVAKGIAKNRIVAKGYGESRLLNHCKNGVECSETEHQLNRRTEFKIIDL